MPKTIKPANYICSSCGSTFSSWSGKCQQCGEWNTLELEVYPTVKSTNNYEIVSLEVGLANDNKRLNTNLSGIDEVFGGGIVEGSVSLISGEPGMGKSTLLLQLAAGVARSSSVLYVSGEESLHQIASRAKRLGIVTGNLRIASSNSAEEITKEIINDSNKLVIIDSIQTIKCDEIGSSPGSVSQVTSSTSLITNAAKQSDTAVIIVGHVTKEGNIAGPKLLEHIVDVVLSLEGDQSGGLKLMRVTKNRYGSTNETAIFEMQSDGLIPVDNPSSILLAERKVTDGSVVLAAMEGSRPILVEVQALVNPTSYGYPKRAASGLDLGRLNLLLAMMERRTTLKLGDKDVYLNIVGGLKISEPAADLAVVMAIASAAKAKKLNANAVVFGEVGLSGEIRQVPFISRRISEAKSQGFDYSIGPKPFKEKTPGFLKPVKDIRSALNEFLS